MHYTPQDSRSLSWNETLPPERMAGAEFVLPWLLDRFGGMLAMFHERFTLEEAELIVEMHEHAAPGSSPVNGLFSSSRVRDAIARSRCVKAGDIDPDALLDKLSAFDEQQLILLRVWAAAYWEQAAPEGMGISRYIS